MWGPGTVPGEWKDVCGFLKPPDSVGQWKVQKHHIKSWLHLALSKGATNNHTTKDTIEGSFGRTLARETERTHQ